MMYSFQGSYPVSDRPTRIRFTDTRLTKTSDITDQDLADTGWLIVENPPNVNYNQKVSWSGSGWVVTDLSADELAAVIALEWNDVVSKRNSLLADVDWRFMRYHSELRQGRQPTDDLASLDVYTQALRDITTQTDPFNLIWPQLVTGEQNNQ